MPKKTNRKVTDVISVSFFIIIVVLSTICIFSYLINRKCEVKQSEQSEQYNDIQQVTLGDKLKRTKKLTFPKLNIPRRLLPEIERNIAFQKLNRERPTWEDSPTIIQGKSNNSGEYTYGWTDGAAGFSPINNMVIICGKDAEELVLTTIDTFGSISEGISRFRADSIQVTENGFFVPGQPLRIQLPPGQVIGERPYLGFRQGCQYSWSVLQENGRNKVYTVYLAPLLKVVGVDVGIFRLENNRLILDDIQELSDLASSGWLTVDPISECLFFCPNFMRNNRNNISFDPEVFYIYNITTRVDGTLTLSRFDSADIVFPVIGCTGGCFSNNGILYLTNNDNNLDRVDQTGVSGFELSYNRFSSNYVFNRVKNYRVTIPEESIFSSDNQELVGIGYFSFFNTSFLGILHRNENILADSISFTKITGMM